jgi:hypothetical protein
MSEDVKDYKALYEAAQAHNTRLEASLEQANAESKRRKDEKATLKAELEDMRALAKEAGTLRGELRTIKHREAAKGLYEDKELGLNPKVPVDRLLTILDYKPENDEFSLEAVKEKLSSLKETDAYLFAEKTDGAESPKTPVAEWARPGERGKSNTKPVALTPAHLSDPVFMQQYQNSLSEKV